MAGFLPLRLRGRPGGAFTPTYNFDQGMGATDATGRVIGYPLQLNGVQYWVDAVNGDDVAYNGYSPYPGQRMNGTPNNGLAPANTYQFGATGPGAVAPGYGPFKTLDKAIQTLPTNARVNGIGNHLKLAKGSLYTCSLTTGINGHRSGLASNPFVMESYDPSDPVNNAKSGRINGPGDYAEFIFNSTFPALLNNSQGDGRNNGGLAVRGIKFTSSTKNTTGQQTINFNFFQPNVIFENNIFDTVCLNLDNGTLLAVGSAFNNDNNIVRLNIFMNQWSTSGGAGVHSQRANVTVEHNFFWNCGWKIGANRADAPSAGGVRGGGLDHSIYMAGQLGQVCDERFNVYVESSCNGVSNRGGGTGAYSVHLDDPGNSITGGSVGTAGAMVENPAGVFGHQRGILVLGTGGSTPFGTGAQMGNVLPGSTIEYPIMMNSPYYATTAECIRLQQEAIPGGIEPTVDIIGLRSYAYAKPERTISINVIGGTPGIAHYTNQDAIVLPTSPYTNEQIIQACGWADKNAMLADISQYPRLGTAWRIYSKTCELLGLPAWRGELEPLPRFKVIHTVTGSATQGGTLTVTNGTIEDGATIAGGQWWRVRPSTGATTFISAPIPGATGLSYNPQVDDVGYRISYVQTIAKGSRTNVAASMPTSVVT